MSPFLRQVVPVPPMEKTSKLSRGTRFLCPQLFHSSERNGVVPTASQDIHSDVITAVLSLGANLARNPPDSRMVAQQCLDDGLQ